MVYVFHGLWREMHVHKGVLGLIVTKKRWETFGG